MSVKQAIIADAGVSSRFLPIVKTVPKSMLPIGNKPIIQLLVEEAVEAGVEKIILVAREETKQIFEDYFHNRREDLEKFLNDMGKPERFEPVRKVNEFPQIEVIVQDPSLPYGTASPILSAKDHLNEGEPFLMLAGDDLVLADERDSSVLVSEFEKDSSYAAYMMAQEIDESEFHLYGMIKFKDGTDDQLDYVIEKPKENAPSNLTTYGRFLYTWKIFDYMKVENTGLDGELWNVDALTELAKNFPVKVLSNKGQWVTTGDPKRYLKAQILFGLQESYGEELRRFIEGL